MYDRKLSPIQFQNKLNFETSFASLNRENCKKILFCITNKIVFCVMNKFVFFVCH